MLSLLYDSTRRVITTLYGVRQWLPDAKLITLAVKHYSKTGPVRRKKQIRLFSDPYGGDYTSGAKSVAASDASSTSLGARRITRSRFYIFLCFRHVDRVATRLIRWTDSRRAHRRFARRASFFVGPSCFLCVSGASKIRVSRDCRRVKSHPGRDRNPNRLFLILIY